MTDEPPEIPSDGDSPTYFDGKPGEPPSAPSLPSEERPTLFDDEARRLLDPGTELPPDLAAEHRAVYLRRGDLVANRFQVVKLLGFGGMGAVYHVKDRELHGQDRALKVMLPSLLRSETARERFLSEVSISQQLAHPGIVRVHDLGLDSGRGFRFFTMEYVPGQTLNRVLKERGGKLPVDEALDVTCQLCDALEYAHQHTVHRDLKPQNVMVQPDGRTKVLDFGLAKLMSPGRMTRSSMALGTAYYQAPEQSVHLSELDQRADIYSLGVMLYQMLTGRIPLGGVKPPSQVWPGVPKRLDAAVMRCIEPEPADRYETAADLRAALDAAGRGKRAGLIAAILAVLILAAAGLATYRFVLTQPPQPTAPPQIATAPRPGPPAPEGAGHGTGATPKSPVPQGELPGESEPPHEPSWPTVTASDASAAKIAAQKAQKAALTAGAETHATELLADARKLLKEGEAHDTLEAFPDAIAKYGKAETAFGNAEQQAEAIAAVEAAQSAMDRVKQEADAVEAKTSAKVRYDQAAKLEEEARTALSISDRVAAAGLFNQSAERYGLAASEAKEYGEAMVAAARKDADAARTAAATQVVERYARKELDDADALVSDAWQAATDANFARANELLEQAATTYPQVAGLASERQAQAKAKANQAQQDAATAKNKIGADERKHAAEEVKTGDDAWTAAEAAATDYAEAERQFKLAKASYEQAVRVTPERIKAAQGPQPGEAEIPKPQVVREKICDDPLLLRYIPCDEARELYVFRGDVDSDGKHEYVYLQYPSGEREDSAYLRIANILDDHLVIKDEWGPWSVGRNGPSYFQVQDLNKDGLCEILVQSGIGNHAQGAWFIFPGDNGYKLRMDVNFEVEGDLNGDGILEVRSGQFVAFEEGSCMADFVYVQGLYNWDGKQLQKVTQDYPEYYRPHISRLRDIILSEPESMKARNAQFVLQQMMGYFGNEFAD